MPRRKKLIIPPWFIKTVVFVIIGIVFFFGIYKAVEYGVVKSDQFKVRKIVVDPSLHFIQKSDVSVLYGKSIFSIDLRQVHERLSRKYPQIDNLRVVRRFPHQISVLAKERMPFAQTVINNKILTIDDHGVILSTTSKRDKRLPFIEGLEDKNNLYALGHPLTGTKILVGLSYVQYFLANRKLDNHVIQSIDVSNLSQVEMLIDNGLKILLDRDKAERKMKVLGVVLAQKNLDFSQIRYIDLRFKEPIIGKK